MIIKNLRYWCQYRLRGVNFCRNWTVKIKCFWFKLLARVLRAYFARDIVSQLKKLFEHILIISDSWSLSRNSYREIHIISLVSDSGAFETSFAPTSIFEVRFMSAGRTLLVIRAHARKISK